MVTAEPRGTAEGTLKETTGTCAGQWVSGDPCPPSRHGSLCSLPVYTLHPRVPHGVFFMVLLSAHLLLSLSITRA